MSCLLLLVPEMAARLLGRLGLGLLKAVNGIERSVVGLFSSAGIRDAAAVAVGVDVGLGAFRSGSESLEHGVDVVAISNGNVHCAVAVDGETSVVHDEGLVVVVGLLVVVENCVSGKKLSFT